MRLTRYLAMLVALLLVATFASGQSAFVGPWSHMWGSDCTAGGRILYHGEIADPGAVASAVGTYTLADVGWSEVVDICGVFDTVPASGDEVCYRGAPRSNVSIRLALSFSSDNAAARVSTTAIGAGETQIADGDEIGTIWLRTHAGSSGTGMGPLEVITDLATNDCIGILFDTDAGTNMTYNNGTITISW
jgi:hypothetical protein